jgi:DNA polymerase I
MSTSALDGITIVRSREHAASVAAKLQAMDDRVFHAWDTEVAKIDVTEQSPVGNGEVICASFFCGPEHDFGNGPRVWIDNFGDAHGTLQEFKAFLEDPGKRKVFHNVGFDRHVLYNEGINLLGLGGDTMHMARLWNTARAKAGGYSLEALSHDLLSSRKVPMKERFAQPKLKRDGTPGTSFTSQGGEELFHLCLLRREGGRGS